MPSPPLFADDNSSYRRAARRAAAARSAVREDRRGKILATLRRLKEEAGDEAHRRRARAGPAPRGSAGAVPAAVLGRGGAVGRRRRGAAGRVAPDEVVVLAGPAHAQACDGGGAAAGPPDRDADVRSPVRGGQLDDARHRGAGTRSSGGRTTTAPGRRGGRSHRPGRPGGAARVTETAIGAVVGCIDRPTPSGPSATSVRAMVQGAGSETEVQDARLNTRASAAGLRSVTETGAPRGTTAPAAGREATTTRRRLISATGRLRSLPPMTVACAGVSPAAQMRALEASRPRPTSSGTVAVVAAAVLPPPPPLSPPPQPASVTAARISASTAPIRMGRGFRGVVPFGVPPDVIWRGPGRRGARRALRAARWRSRRRPGCRPRRRRPARRAGRTGSPEGEDRPRRVGQLLGPVVAAVLDEAGLAAGLPSPDGVAVGLVDDRVLLLAHCPSGAVRCILSYPARPRGPGPRPPAARRALRPAARRPWWSRPRPLSTSAAPAPWMA